MRSGCRRLRRVLRAGWDSRGALASNRAEAAQTTSVTHRLPSGNGISAGSSLRTRPIVRERGERGVFPIPKSDALPGQLAGTLTSSRLAAARPRGETSDRVLDV